MGKQDSLYYQIAEDLLTKIEDGRYRPGEFLPSEKKLEKRYEASRTTIRSAIDLLVNQGVIKTIHGRGNRVISKPSRQDVSTLASFSDILHQQGLTSGLSFLNIENIRVSPEIVSKLQLKPSTLVTRIERVRTADGEPVSHQVSYVPFDIGNQITEKALRRSTSLYHTIKDATNTQVAYARDEITARAASSQECQMLDLPPHSPVLVLYRTAYGEGKIPVEYAVSVMKSDKFYYSVFISSSDGL